MSSAVQKLPESKQKSVFALVLTNTEGHITETCARTGISYSKYRRWLENDPEFAEECDQARIALVDLGQSHLVENVRLGKSTDIQFLLKTQGRDRGYGDKVEHEHTGVIGHAHALGYYPPEPKTIADWETQVIEADRLRAERANALTEGPNRDVESTSPINAHTGTLNTGPVARSLALVPAT